MGAGKDDERMDEAGVEVAQEDVAMNGEGESSGKDEGVVSKAQVRDCMSGGMTVWLFCCGDVMPSISDDSRALAPLQALFTTEHVYVHPLVLLSVVDHYNRAAKDTRKRAVGVLLGERRKVCWTNSLVVGRLAHSCRHWIHTAHWSFGLRMTDRVACWR